MYQQKALYVHTHPLICRAPQYPPSKNTDLQGVAEGSTTVTHQQLLRRKKPEGENVAEVSEAHEVAFLSLNRNVWSKGSLRSAIGDISGQGSATE